MIDFHRETACGNLRLRSVGRKHCADPETTTRAKAVSQQQPRSTAHEAHDGLGIVTSAVRLRGHVEHNSQLPTSHVPGYVIFFSFSLLHDLFFLLRDLFSFSFVFLLQCYVGHNFLLRDLFSFLFIFSVLFPFYIILNFDSYHFILFFSYLFLLQCN